jgi:gamma-carbonic anhydrase
LAGKPGKINLAMSIHIHHGKEPQLSRDVFIAEGAQLIGEVTVGEASSIWFGSVLRGDINCVVIGHHTNIQDLSVCHVADERACEVGNYVTCGHRAILHGCTVRDEVLIGMGAVLMNGVVVGEQCIIGAAALLTEGLEVPPGSLVYGSPAKVISRLGEKERHAIKGWAEKYCRVAASYRGAA